MKLLSPTQTKDLREQEVSRNLLRIEETEQAVKKSNISLAKSQADFCQMLARNRADWEKEEKDHQERILEMTKEVSALESKKKQALIPIEVYSSQVDMKMEALAEDIVALKEREEANEDLADKLQDKLDEVGEREQTLKKRELGADMREKGLESQAKGVIEGVERLTKEMEAFTIKRAKAEQDIGERKKALTLWDQSLVAKDNLIKDKEKELADWDIRLHDERETLDRAFTELKSKQLSP